MTKFVVSHHTKECLIMFKIVNDLAPSYLIELLPETVGNATPYNLRNSSHVVIPPVRLASFQSSFFPSTIILWNRLQEEIRNKESVSSFKKALKPQFLECSHLKFKNRKDEILISRLRNRSSKLNYEVFRVNLINDPSCNCGFPIEDTDHYFLNCPLYNVARQKLIDKLHQFQPLYTNLLTQGSQNLTQDQNYEIAIAVSHYIKSTKRFE